MRAGPMRHRITLETPAETQTPDGSVTRTWAPFATVWASVEPLLGREWFDAQREQADVSHRVRMRFLAGVSHNMRVMLGSRVFEIESVINAGERNRELVLMCRESV
jgi:SPP1 family predicted phage head-tail adaptor